MRAVSLLLAIGFALAGAGCAQRVEVNDVAIVTMIGLDRNPEGEWLLQLQIARPQNMASAAGGGMGLGEGGDGEAAPSVTLEAPGESFAAAFRSLQTDLSRRIIFSHARVIVLGEPLARAGVEEALGFLARDPQVRETAFVVVSHGPSLPVLETESTAQEMTSAEAIRRQIERRFNLRVMLTDFVRALVEEGSDPVATGIVVTEERGMDRVHVEGAALFRGARMVGWMNDEQMHGLLWLRDEVTTGLVTVPNPIGSGKVGLIVLRARSALRPSEEDPLRLEFIAEGEDDLVEVSGDFDPTDPYAIAVLQETLERDVARRVSDALAVLKRFRVDGADLGRAIERHDPTAWRELKEGWRERLGAVTLVPRIETRVLRPGFLTAPLTALPPEELGR